MTPKLACEGVNLVGYPIWTPADGSMAMCQMCGGYFPSDTERVPDHDRPDIIAMLDRGDFG